MATVTSPVLTDATGANIVTKLEAIKNAVQPTNACTDIDITIPASGWSGSSPYMYTYATAHVTPGCSVKVNFLEGSEDTSVFYLEYEKVSTGVRFTAPSLPDSDIPVRIHILAADAESVAATSADQVSTDAVLGASNVQQALGTLNDQIASFHHTWTKIAEETTTANQNFDKTVYVTYPSGLSEIMFTLQRVSNGRTFATSVCPITQFQGGAIYAFGAYVLTTGKIIDMTGVQAINAVAIQGANNTIELAMNANDEAIKMRVFVR